MKRILLVLLLVVATAGAAAALDPTDWRTARPITLPRLAAPGWVYLPLDAEALATEFLDEYRVVGPGGKEIPYRMLLSTGEVESRTLPATLISEAHNPTQVQGVVDLGEPPAKANRLELLLVGNNFRGQVAFEGSADNKTWWSLKGGGLVYRHEGKFEQAALPLPATDYRYLRVTISKIEGKQPVLDGVRLISQVPVPEKLVEVPAKVTQRVDAKERTSVIEFEVSQPTRDVTLIKLDVAEPRFSRSAWIQLSEDGKEYHFGQSAPDLERAAPGQETTIRAALPIFRRLRLTTTNGDDPPLTIRSAKLLRAERGLLFSADPAAQYQLWYGRPDAPQPNYDIERLPLPASPAALPVATLGPAQELPRKPTPWSEKHPAVFWAALGLAVVLLGLLIYRGLRGMAAGRADSSPPPGQA